MSHHVFLLEDFREQITHRTAYAHVARKVRARSPTVPNVCVSLRSHTLIDVGAVRPVEAFLVERTRQAGIVRIAGQVQMHREIHKWAIYDATVCIHITAAESGGRIED